MSDVIIKGIEMPKKCLGSLTGVGDCLIVGKCKTFQNTDLETKEKIAWDSRLPNCPLVELPPHGRLIDVDALEIDDSWSLTDTGRIWNAPTILESTK